MSSLNSCRPDGAAAKACTASLPPRVQDAAHPGRDSQLRRSVGDGDGQGAGAREGSREFRAPRPAGESDTRCGYGALFWWQSAVVRGQPANCGASRSVIVSCPRFSGHVLQPRHAACCAERLPRVRLMTSVCICTGGPPVGYTLCSGRGIHGRKREAGEARQ